MLMHLAALLAMIRSHPYALRVYLMLWVASIFVSVVRWGV